MRLATADGGLLDGIHQQSIADENVEHKRSAVSIPVCVRARARACASVSTHTPVRRYGGTRVVRHCTTRMRAHRICGTLPVAHSIRCVLSAFHDELARVSGDMRCTSYVARSTQHVTLLRLRLCGLPPYQCAQSSPVVSHSNADEITCRATPGSARKAKPGSGPQVSS
jgi:hypothetical protein